jgi:hypothetical protein
MLRGSIDDLYAVLGRMLRGSIEDLYAVRRYIDDWRTMNCGCSYRVQISLTRMIVRPRA